MDNFDLLKSHIEAFTRKDGSVVQAHDDKRVKKSTKVTHKVGDLVTNKKTGASAKVVKVDGDSVHVDFGSKHGVHPGTHKEYLPKKRMAFHEILATTEGRYDVEGIEDLMSSIDGKGGEGKDPYLDSTLKNANADFERKYGFSMI